MNQDIFQPRTNILPYEYPQLLAYKDAIRHSYWIDTEFNFTEDVQDFKIHITQANYYSPIPELSKLNKNDYGKIQSSALKLDKNKFKLYLNLN